MSSKYILDILKKNRAKEEHYTHGLMSAPYGKFILDRMTNERIWKLICEGVYDKEKLNLSLQETLIDYMPVIVDIDIKVLADDVKEDKLYTQDDVKNIIGSYQTCLRTLLEPNSCDETTLICLLLEKPSYTTTSKSGTTYKKNGFHLHFPYCYISRRNYEYHLYPRVVENIKELNLFSRYDIKTEDIIDKNIYRNSWLIYGMSKEGSEPYKVTKAYNAELNEMPLNSALENYPIYDERNNVIEMKHEPVYYLPRILSVKNNIEDFMKEFRRNIIAPAKERAKRKVLNLEQTTENCDLEYVEKLIDMLSEDRARDHNDRMAVGWTLFNITNGSQEGLNLWCKFCQKCMEKYDEEKCESRWENMTHGTLTIRSLRYFAKKDNPDAYCELSKDKRKNYLYASLDGADYDIANALFEDYGDDYVCTGIKDGIWYRFHSHKWEEMDSGVYLSKKISSSFILRYIDINSELYTQLAECSDKFQEKIINNKIDNVNKLKLKLKNSAPKQSIMRECRIVFYNPNFTENLDMNPYIIGFKNGVYDLKNHIFREGRPEDYISKSCPIPYRTYDKKGEKYKNIELFLEQIFPDESVRRYFLDQYSEIFVGGNSRKIVNFWTGDGDNGKSIMQMLLDKTLGDYTKKIDSKAITGTKGIIGNANADLSRTGGGVRSLTIEEPNDDEVINCGVYKHLSGNDSYFARDLFEKGKKTKEIKPMYKLTIICNKKPRFRNADKAVWNRTRVIPFETTFCKNMSEVPATHEERLRQKKFPVDINLSLKLSDMAPVFAYYLLEYRKKEKLKVEPDKVLKATQEYRQKNDIYTQYMNERVITDDEKSVSYVDLYDDFKTWSRDSMPNIKIPCRPDVVDDLSKLLGKTRGKFWHGYRLRTEEDDIRDGQIVKIETVSYTEEEKQKILRELEKKEERNEEKEENE